jgi:predicted RNA-binding protein with PIN domain
MSQAAEMKEANSNSNTNEPEPERVYCTNALIKKVGRAVAVSLEDATLPGNTKNKHMTILYRSGSKWTGQEIALMSKETDNWIKEKYGNNKAPVTFTIHKYGPKSCKIEGDLNELCLHLRLKFAQLCNAYDQQRLPHVELFKHARAHRHGKSHDKSCHICGESGHFKRHCPMKQDKKRRYADNGNVYPTPHSKKCGKNNTEKMKEKLRKMISKTNELKHKKQNEVDILDEQEAELQQLFDIADTLDAKTLRNRIKNIAKSFRNKKKSMRKCNKNKNKKCNKWNKQARKGAKQERKLAKEERKRLKKEKKEKLALAQLEALPVNISGNELYIYVDGYNIIGCDNVCRKSMRRRGGMKKSRRRLSTLLQEEFINKYKSGVLGLNYVPIVKLYFDGNGMNEVCGDIEITFSTKKQIVDDKLVEIFSKNNKKENGNILVITSDRELTLRLYDIGVQVMKSSTFYKTFLKGNGDVDMVDDDEKKEDTEPGTNDGDDSDEFVKIIAAKMNGVADEDEDTSTDYEQVEGDNDENIDMDADYYEFTTIFGEDMDVDSN